MKIEIIEERANPLLNRQEIMFRATYEGGTPSREEIRKMLVETLKKKPELIVVERMRNKFGKRETTGYAKVYESEERIREIERKHIIKRNFSGEENENT
ncbi:MAG: 30S ribosomal protein S24e [Candidatus Syntropharchaeia archaeon]